MKLFGRKGDTYDDILNWLVDCPELPNNEEIVEARWLKHLKEKRDYIPDRRYSDGSRLR